jgi:type VI secretion system protein ImpM
MIAGVSPGGGFSAGWYGKIPAAGDFIARRVPPSFSQAWDRWLQTVIGGSRARLAARWRDAFLSMPVWRFVLSPAMLNVNAWAGVMVPSVDAVGRYFPLAVASALPSASLDLVATLLAARSWFQDIEAIALSALGPGTDSDSIDAAIAGKPFLSQWLRHPEAHDDTVPIRGAKPQMLWVPLGDGQEEGARELGATLGEPAAAWLAEASELFGRCLLLCEALPEAEQYCAMMDGRWIEHGWRRRDTGDGGVAD